MKNFQFSITLVASLLLIFINTWVTLALGFILAGMKLTVHLILKNHIKPEHVELFDANGSSFGTLSRLTLWDGLQFDQTKVLITAIQKGDYFDVVIALYAGADAELGMMANSASNASNQENIKQVLLHFGAEQIEGEDDEAMFVDELDLDNYYPIRDLSMNFLEAEGIIDEGYRPVQLDQIKGVLLAVDRFGVRKTEKLETTLSQNRMEIKTEDEIDKEVRSFLSRFSMHETIRDEHLTFYSKAQRVPCINPLCQYGKVICPTCEGEKNVSCDDCDGTGILEIDVEIEDSVQEALQCQECNGTGFEPGDLIDMKCDCREKEDCKVCGGKGIIKEDYCHNCEGSGKVCVLCGGSGVFELLEKGPVCKTCGGVGVIESQPMSIKNTSTTSISCKRCDGTGSIICKTCQGIGTLACESCEGHGHMYRNVKMDVELDAFPKGDHTYFVQFDQEELNQIFVTEHAKIINNLRTIDDVKIYRHEDRMVGKIFHKPVNSLLVGVNKFLGGIDAPYNQAYERVELIVATYHYITITYYDGTTKQILLLNNNEFTTG